MQIVDYFILEKIAQNLKKDLFTSMFTLVDLLIIKKIRKHVVTFHKY